MFPQKTYEVMRQKVRERYFTGDFFRKKFEEIYHLKDIDKKNRWFGYYQNQGERMGLWSLEEIRESVRNEINE